MSPTFLDLELALKFTVHVLSSKRCDQSSYVFVLSGGHLEYRFSISVFKRIDSPPEWPYTYLRHRLSSKVKE
ncbi:hypothetical protein Bpfe_011307 [Biomphalaria pfeifferi]|uniref:Uncharacterized protein n=1 Tax=Biomphalaria pfeifferi TaxID=112525 RepID=A0AAD8BR22_BIOPF|nr:hypothetical protein Bpfe_011307 [Biomphalaria pfeifferi]